MKAKRNQPTRKVRFDTKDIDLIRSIHELGDSNPKELYQATKIPLSTLQKRLGKLKRLNLLKTQVDFSKHPPPFPTRAMISIHADPEEISHGKQYDDQKGLCRYLSKMSSGELIVENANVLLGAHADIVVFVSAASTETLLNFVTNKLRRLPGVRNTNTAMVFSPDETSSILDPK